jgi:tetratricopeptide (TPR) repeat protein
MLRAIISPAPKDPPDYRFNTLTAVAGVRGTDFALIHRGEANVFFGNAGKVEVQGLNTDTRALTAATVVQTTRGNTPTQAIRVEPNSRLAQAQTLLNEVTDAAPESWVEAGKLPEVVARWNITYSRYLADADRHAEALHVLQVALDLTKDPDIQADAHLERGAVFSRDPNRGEAALAEYAAVLAMPPSDTPVAAQRETALYMSGMGLYQLNRAADARARLQQYLRDYPQGRFKERVETLLRTLDKPAR